MSKRETRRLHALKKARLPEHLFEATQFSDDELLDDPIDLIKIVKSSGIWQRFGERTKIAYETGRPRASGDYPLLYLRYLLSTYTRLTVFKKNDLRESAPIAGFLAKPSYSTLHLRFAELEEDRYVKAFEAMIIELITLARKRFPQIGEVVYIDATNVHSRARLHFLDGDGTSSVRGGPAENTLIDREHIKETDAPESEPVDLGHVPIQGHEFPNMIRLKSGQLAGCFDPTAGVRTYKIKSKGTKKRETYKWWVGCLDVKAVDHFTGITMFNHVIQANEQEDRAFFVLMRKHRLGLGSYPEAVTADRAHAGNRTYAWTARKRIEFIAPFRRPHGSITDEQDMRTSSLDEFGPRCKHCGGPAVTTGARMGMHIRNRKPRLYFRCRWAPLPACLEAQSMDVLKQGSGIRFLSTSSPDTERHHALAVCHSIREKSHDLARERYGAGGADKAGRLRRFGLPAQRLRTVASIFLDWFRFCLRYGIFGDHPNVVSPQILIRRGDRRLREHLAVRLERGLDVPYGPAAFASGFAATDEIPEPVRRPRDGPRTNPK